MTPSTLTSQDRDIVERERYENWVAGIKEKDPAQYRQLKKDGLDKYPNDYNMRGKGKEDIGEREDLEEAPQAPQLDEQLDEKIQNRHVHAQVMAGLRVIIAELLAAKNTKLAVRTLSASTNLIYNGDSLAEIARTIGGISRAGVSKGAVGWCSLLGLPPPRAMRKLTTRKNYAKRAVSTHTRRDGRFI